MFRSRNFPPFIVAIILMVMVHGCVVSAQEASSGRIGLIRADLHLSGSLGAHGILLLTEGAPSLKVVAEGQQPEIGLSVAFHIYDHRGEERLSVTVPLGVGGGAELDLGLFQPGWYRVRYRILEDDGLRELARGSRDFVIIRGYSDFPASTGPFGVVNERLTPPEAHLLRHMGSGWIWAAATPTWAEVQVQPGGRLMWRARREAVEAARTAGLIPAGNVGQEPVWVGLPGLASDPYLTDFYRYVRALTQELPAGAAISAVPLFDSVWDERTSDYIKRIKITSGALHDREKPVSQILEAENLTPHAIEQLASHGALESIDAVLLRLPPFHSQPEEIDWDFLEQLRAQLRTYGSGAEVWTVTPNVPNAKAEHSRATVSLFGVPTPSETEAQGSFDTLTQAQWLVRSHVLQLAHGVGRIFAAPFSTGPSELRLFTGGAGAYPDMPQRPRPSVAAYATMAEKLTGATYMGQLSMPEGIWAFAFSKQGEAILVVWTTRPSATLELNNVNVPVVSVTDMMGARAELVVDGGRLVLPVSQSPQYVHGLGVGVLAQALIDHFRQRAELLSDVAAWAAEDVDRLADRVYKLATQLWVLGQDPAADLAPLLPTWYETVDQMLQFGYSLLGGGASATGALYEVYELLSVMAELGAVLGIGQSTDEQRAQVTGTDALLAEAYGALLERMEAAGNVVPHGMRLMQKVRRWWDESAYASLRARTAWSVIAREGAALAMMQALAETPQVAERFLLAETVELERPFPGFNVYEAGATAADVWAYVEQFLAGWIITRELDLSAGKGQKHDAEEDGAGLEGWDVLPLQVTAVNFSEHMALSHLVLDGPEGWLWAMRGEGSKIRQVGERVTIELPAGLQEGGRTIPLAIDLLIPHDASVGTYEVVLTLSEEGGVADQITFNVQVGDGPRPGPSLPHVVEQLPTASPS